MLDPVSISILIFIIPTYLGISSIFLLREIRRSFYILVSFTVGILLFLFVETVKSSLDLTEMLEGILGPFPLYVWSFSRDHRSPRL
ncbi:MAG: hypothetical protein ACUVTD_07465 [Nitrososphaerales archaeon]